MWKNGCVKIGNTEMYYAAFGKGPEKLAILPGLSDGLVTVKGKALIRIEWLGEDGNGPVQASFSAPFSQIIDIGAESMELCTVQPQITGA